MPWRFRREGSSEERGDLSLDQIVAGLRDGKIEATDEVLGPGEAEWTPIENHPELADVADELEPPRRRLHDDPTTLDMNPLIDVCLVLLVFFILTTSYAAAVIKVIPLASIHSDKRGIPVLPQKTVRERMIEVEAWVKSGTMHVRVQGQSPDVFKADGSLDGKKLEAALKPYTTGADRRTEMLLEARGVDWGTVVKIQDHARAVGVLKITHKLP